MAKTPETRDRFRIICETEDTHQLGPIIAELARLGLNNVKYELITDVLRFRKNASGNNEIGSEAFLMSWLESHPTFRASDVVQHFIENGRGKSAAYTILRLLSEKGVLKSLGKGNYARGDVKALSSPKKETHKYEVSNHDLVLREMPKTESFTRKQIAQLLQNKSRTAASASPTCTWLLRKKLIKRVGKGMYMLTAKALKHAETPHLNGNGATEALHG